MQVQQSQGEFKLDAFEKLVDNRRSELSKQLAGGKKQTLDEVDKAMAYLVKLRKDVEAWPETVAQLPQVAKPVGNNGHVTVNSPKLQLAHCPHCTVAVMTIMRAHPDTAFKVEEMLGLLRTHGFKILSTREAVEYVRGTLSYLAKQRKLIKDPGYGTGYRLRKPLKSAKG